MRRGMVVAAGFFRQDVISQGGFRCHAATVDGCCGGECMRRWRLKDRGWSRVRPSFDSKGSEGRLGCLSMRNGSRHCSERNCGCAGVLLATILPTTVGCCSDQGCREQGNRCGRLGNRDGAEAGGRLSCFKVGKLSEVEA